MRRDHVWHRAGFHHVDLQRHFAKAVLWGIGVLYAVSAILRLARFNVQKNEHAPTSYFQGLPTPMAAGAIASFAIAMPNLIELTDASMPEASQELGRQLIAVTMFVVPILAGLLAWLMVSHIRYPHIASELSRRRSFSQLVELVFAMVIVITLKEVALPILFTYFVLAPPVNQLRLRATSRGQAAVPDSVAPNPATAEDI